MKQLTERIDPLFYAAQVAKHSSDAICITDLTGQSFFHSQAFVDLLGEKPEELNARGGMRSLFAEAEVAENVLTSLAQGRFWRGLVVLESPRKKKIWILLKADIIRDPQENAIGWMLISTSLIPLAEHEDQRLVMMLEASTDYVGMCNRQGQVLYNNAILRRFTGIGQDLSHITLADQHPPWVCDLLLNEAMPTAIRAGTWTAETALLNRQGQYIPVSQTIHYQKNFDGGIEYFFTIMRDITQQKEIERQLHHKAQLEQALNKITRDIRASLNLDDIQSTAAQELAEILKVDRVEIFQYKPESSCWILIGDGFHSPDLPSHLGMVISDQDNPIADRLKLLEVVRCNNVADNCSGVPDSMDCKILDSMAQSRLIVPLHFQNQVWGTLTLTMETAPRRWQDEEVELVTIIAAQLSIAIQQAQAFAQVQEQAKQEHLLNSIIQSIRQSLNLEQVLQQTVDILQTSFGADRCAISLCTEQDQEFRHLALAVSPGAPNILGEPIPIADNPHAQAILAQDNPVMVTDTETSPLFAPVRSLAQKLQTRAVLGVRLGSNGCVYGLLTVQQCFEPRIWTTQESLLLKQVADQIAIAIEHSQMFRQIEAQTVELALSNEQLEARIERRTNQLRQALDFQMVLNRIADNVRYTLDEAQILQTAATELAAALLLSSCHVAVYDDMKTTATIVAENRDLTAPSQLDQTLRIDEFPETFNALFSQTPGYLDNPSRQESWMLCGIGDDRVSIGYLALCQPETTKSWSELTIDLAQQVANHCFIALRQARLYRASLDHVVKLEQLSLLKDDFLSTVSHELRTPVSNMNITLNLLKKEVAKTGPPNQKQQKYIKILEQECQREIKLINDLLTFQKLDGHEEPLATTEIQLQTWLPALLAPFEMRMREQQQQFTLDLPEDFRSITTEVASLERTITELLNNAVKYTPPQQSIILKISSDATHWQFELSNTGIAITAEQVDRIFDKFYRIPSNDRWQQPGTGLGLALVKNLVIRLSGQIRVSSADLTVTFIARFPNTPLLAKDR